MIQSLKKAGSEVRTKVLLSCTSGFTTSFFADKLNDAAKTLGPDYDFSAVPYVELFEAAQDQDVILLAYYHPFGTTVSGAGIVLNGHLIIGKRDIAGNATITGRS